MLFRFRVIYFCEINIFSFAIRDDLFVSFLYRTIVSDRISFRFSALLLVIRVELSACTLYLLVKSIGNPQDQSKEKDKEKAQQLEQERQKEEEKKRENEQKRQQQQKKGRGRGPGLSM